MSPLQLGVRGTYPPLYETLVPLDLLTRPLPVADSLTGYLQSGDHPPIMIVITPPESTGKLRQLDNVRPKVQVYLKPAFAQHCRVQMTDKESHVRATSERSGYFRLPYGRSAVSREQTESDL